MNEISEYEMIVTFMRQRGIVRLKTAKFEIELGPEPKPDVVDPVETERTQAEIERRRRQAIHDTLFGATSMRPKL